MATRAYGLGLIDASLTVALDIITTETPGVVHVPRLTDDAVGATAVLLDGLAVRPGPRAWELSSHADHRTRTLRDDYERTLDACEEAWGTKPETVKVQVMGPWSLAAQVELPRGYLAMTDPGALRDLTEALAELISTQCAEVRRRFDAKPIVQIDEPKLVQVVAGGIAGPTQLDPVRAVHVREVGERLNGIVDKLHAADSEVLLNLTGQPPLFEAARLAGADGVQVSREEIRGTELMDGLGHTWASETRVAIDPRGTDARDAAIELARLTDELALNREVLTRTDVWANGTARSYQLASAVADILARDAGDL